MTPGIEFISNAVDFFLLQKKNMESKCEKNNSPETASKSRSKKLQEKTGDLVENKIAEKITKVSLKNKTNQQIKKKLTAEEL